MFWLKKKLPSNTDNTFTDPRDGKVYKTVKIGKQVWMAENLAFDAKGSKCYNKKYGRHYDWETAKKACPQGWHLPTNEEWEELMNFAGGLETAGKTLKATSCNGTDDFGFTALLCGFCSSGNFSNVGTQGGWWSATECEANDAWLRYINDTDAWMFSYDGDKNRLYSVRCIKD